MDTVDEVLKLLDPEELDHLKKSIVKNLISKKVFYKFRLLGRYYRVAVDATGIMQVEKGHCEHCLKKTYNKGKPIQIKEFDLEKQWWNNREDKKFEKHCWKVSLKEIQKRKYNLDINNPNGKAEEENLSSKEILDKLEESFEKSKELIQKIKGEV